MKKHFVLIMNIVLIVAILGATGFTVFNVIRNANKEPAKTSQSVTEPADDVDTPTAYPTVDPQERYRIGIVQHYNNADSNDCYAGFISEMNERGLIGNVDIVYVIEENEERCNKEIRRLIDENCDLLCTIGPYASKAAAQLTTDVPIVFAGVADPEQAGLVNSNENPGGNVTGVSSYTPTFEQVDLINILLPQAKNIATLYNATDENAVMQAILAEKEADELGMKTQKYPINRAGDIDSALEELQKAGTQAIYLPVDKYINKYLKNILSFTDKNKIPVFVGNETMLRQGAFATSAVNYTSIGRKSAGLCYDILFSKKDPATLSVNYKHDCYNIVNTASVEALGIRLNQTQIDQVQMKDYSTEE
ncbi:MAG: ABC transporter substrate-binding protein [Ruminococcus sp.]|nr:ABC transporter substrate-binding protein [Ruminococcus sp.]